MLSISSSELYSLIMAGQSAIIIMDTRPASDFAESHIKYSGCISIPQEILKPGWEYFNAYFILFYSL